MLEPQRRSSLRSSRPRRRLLCVVVDALPLPSKLQLEDVRGVSVPLAIASAPSADMVTTATRARLEEAVLRVTARREETALARTVSAQFARPRKAIKLQSTYEGEGRVRRGRTR
ncbi:hypothetical protein PC116_g31701 [Phytophthora cactorum]|uniref:Uncharacterized protein n=1 Tax=Phytophthora cactorum TaxID=29920 RepID=A0A8T1A4P0_9STRA|nr:hypothetical protein PC117_g28488 [Phytophthora cactorum]KAG4219819.1 hypothetical protein PC116_g31701 [Phytophthora cactorum]